MLSGMVLAFYTRRERFLHSAEQQLVVSAKATHARERGGALIPAARV